jgi:hypothetical protein
VLVGVLFDSRRSLSSKVVEALARIQADGISGGQQHPDAPHSIGWLRVRGARPNDCSAAKKSEEFAAPCHP